MLCSRTIKVFSCGIVLMLVSSLFSFEKEEKIGPAVCRDIGNTTATNE